MSTLKVNTFNANRLISTQFKFSSQETARIFKNALGPRVNSTPFFFQAALVAIRSKKKEKKLQERGTSKIYRFFQNVVDLRGQTEMIFATKDIKAILHRYKHLTCEIAAFFVFWMIHFGFTCPKLGKIVRQYQFTDCAKLVFIPPTMILSCSL